MEKILYSALFFMAMQFMSIVSASTVACNCDEQYGGVSHNRFVCVDISTEETVYDAWCATNEICYGASISNNWPSVQNFPCAVTCTCDNPGQGTPNNHFTCTDGHSAYCASNEICYGENIPRTQGWPCVIEEMECVDTDGNNSDNSHSYSERLTPGRAYTPNAIAIDTCVSATQIRESFCNGGVPTLSDPVNCGSGYLCQTDNQGGSFCTEPCLETDNGNDKFYKGTTTSGTQASTDYCISANQIKEYYCSPNVQNIYEVIAPCGAGYQCQDGACVSIGGGVEEQTRQIRINIVNAVTGSSLVGANVTIKKDGTIVVTQMTLTSGYTPYITLNENVNYVMIISRPGFETRDFNLYIPAEGSGPLTYGPFGLHSVEDAGEEEDEPTRNIVVKTTGITNNSIANVTVSIREGTTNDPIVFTGVTNNDGLTNAAELKIGFQHIFLLQKEGYETKAIAQTIPEGEGPHTLDFVFEEEIIQTPPPGPIDPSNTRRVKVRVTHSETSSNVNAALVRIIKDGTIEVDSDSTDFFGKTKNFDFIVNQLYKIIISKDSFRDRVIDYTVSDGNSVVVLSYDITPLGTYNCFGCSCQEVEPNYPPTMNRIDAASCTEAMLTGDLSVNNKDADFFFLHGFQEIKKERRVHVEDHAGLVTAAHLYLFDENNNLHVMYSSYGSGSPSISGIPPIDIPNPKVGIFAASIDSDDSYQYVVAKDEETVSFDHTQTVYIDFRENHDVQVGSSGAENIQEFDITELHENWENEDNDIVMRQIVSKLEIIYADYPGIEFIPSYESPLPSEPHATLYIGNLEDPFLIGSSDKTDDWNQFKGGTAIVYAENFGEYGNYGYDVDDITNGIASVGAHEVGHLLGLLHVIPGQNEVMDVDPTVSLLVTLDSFQRQPLATYLVPFEGGGELYQDAPMLLHAILGGESLSPQLSPALQCSHCGAGLFNVCDYHECELIQEGCVFAKSFITGRCLKEYAVFEEREDEREKHTDKLTSRHLNDLEKAKKIFVDSDHINIEDFYLVMEREIIIDKLERQARGLPLEESKTKAERIIQIAEQALTGMEDFLVQQACRIAKEDKDEQLVNELSNYFTNEEAKSTCARGLGGYWY